MNACIHHQDAADRIHGFDARGVARRFRHAAIIGALDALQPGETMRFVNDHDPLPLLNQLGVLYGDRLRVNYLARQAGEVIIDFIKQPPARRQAGSGEVPRLSESR